MQQQLQDVYKAIDEILGLAAKDGSGIWLDGTARQYNKPGHIAKEIILRNNLVSLRNPGSDRSLCDITLEGLHVLEMGGYEKFIEVKREKQKREENERQLEVDLAKSNLEANEIQKKAASDNRRFSRINIAFALLNIALLVWQLLKK